MKKISLVLILALMVVGSTSFADTGKLFSVAISGKNLTITPTANHYYPSMGIQLTSKHTVSGCEPSSNGYCLFEASNKKPHTLTISGPGNKLEGTICMSGPAEYSCQLISFSRYKSAVCASAGGKIISGATDACWIPQQQLGAYKCAQICSSAGLTLVQPGPVNNASLAAAVLTAFGFTAPPTMLGGSTVIWADVGGGTNHWDIDNGTNWNNPVGASYFCTGTCFFACPCG